MIRQAAVAILLSSCPAIGDTFLRDFNGYACHAEVTSLASSLQIQFSKAGSGQIRVLSSSPTFGDIDVLAPQPVQVSFDGTPAVLIGGWFDREKKGAWVDVKGRYAIDTFLARLLDSSTIAFRGADGQDFAGVHIGLKQEILRQFVECAINN